ncbi:very short patch repair endonuclease [Fictibacillus sp. 5RED26]|uniref:very short patch repair endonuclease n=1 Tax=Fictibacillus sp. 5RED26 TaxID=2745876 RepID=UPI0018CDA93C|nr:very short patch repair endonuclease [Fictibacillus sp. 5RED26]MBH0157308.1 very short patch repair endonuclease [Fictibacillus sp. 5RED26]
MREKITKEQRRKNMQAIRSQSKLENMVTRELWKRGLRFRKNVKTLYGKPDIAIQKYKVVIFIDSCFWHACDLHGNIPKTNQEYWIKKLNRNKTRDLEVEKYYLNNDWHYKRVWEHDLKKDFYKVINELESFINKLKTQ